MTREDVVECLDIKLWWLRGAMAQRVIDAVLADPPLDGRSETLEDDIEARLPPLAGNSPHLVVGDVAIVIRARDA